MPGRCPALRGRQGAHTGRRQAPCGPLRSWRCAGREPTSDRPAPKRTTPVVGKRTELARYTVEGERVVYGQRVDGVVRFQPEEQVVLDPSSGPSEDGRCCPREPIREEPRPGAARQQRGDDAHGEAAAGAAGRGRTGVRVELARYSVSAGDRALYGQRVDGVVRVTDVPLAGGGRAYLVERGLEEEGSNANAALRALIADYLRQARVLDAVPMAGRRGAV